MPLHPALRRYVDPPDFPIVRYVLAGAACGFAGIALALGLLHVAEARTENAHQARIECHRSGLSVTSSGPDRVFDTTDDIRSPE